MQNDQGQVVDLYIPRKCSATNRILTAKDHASVQINIGHLDKDGVFTGDFTTFAFCGFIREQGRSDASLNRLAAKQGLIQDISKFPGEHLFRSAEKADKQQQQ